VGGASFLSRSRVHTPASGKQRMVHALYGLNEVTTRRPCKYELIRDVPAVLRPDDWMLSVDAEAAFWSVSIHPQSRKFMSSHYALPTFYESEWKATFVPLQPGGSWALQHQVARSCPRPPKPNASTPPGLRELHLGYRAQPRSHAIRVDGFASHLGSSFQGCCRSPSTSRPPRSGICR